MSLPDPSSKPVLTEREREILRLISQGYDNRIIGDKLGIARSTVESHLHIILRKLGAANRTEAVVIAIHLGLIDDNP